MEFLEAANKILVIRFSLCKLFARLKMVVQQRSDTIDGPARPYRTITGADPTAQRRGRPPRRNGADAMTRPPHGTLRGRDARRGERREQNWLADNAPRQCCVCGKWFVRRADRVCSRDCLAKLEAQGKQQPTPRWCIRGCIPRRHTAARALRG